MRPLPTTPRRRPRLLPLALALALTVGAVWWLAPPAAVPDYRGEWAAGGAPCDAAPCALGLGGELSVVARPESPPEGPIAARVYLVGERSTRRYAAVLEASGDGVVRFEGRPKELFAGMEAGPYELVVAVGRSRFLPLDGAELDALARRPVPQVRLLRRALVVSSN